MKIGCRILILFLLVGFASCGDKERGGVPEGFVTDTMLRITPVKDQGRSELCWAFAMLATIETEHLERGDSVNLSTDYVARMFLAEQAKWYFESHGRRKISMRGIGAMLTKGIREYGIVPYDSYYSHVPVNYNVLKKKTERLLDLHMKRNSTWEKCEADLQSLFDKEIGYLPGIVFMLGAEYSTLEFAHSVCRNDEYTALTSNPQEPYYKEVDPHLTDNQYRQTAFNIPADTLVRLVEHSIRQRHPVFWEGGPNDNHAVALVGLGHDRAGKKYFIAKNSWGKDNPTNGLLYIKYNKVKRQTALVLMQTDLAEKVPNQ